MNKNKNLYLLLASLGIPVVIYLFFLPWMTTTIYGDDLIIYSYHKSLQSFGEKINIDVPFGKFRPLHSVGIHVLIEFFQKNLNYYYCFNISVQAINTFIFALILNLFLQSPYLSLAIGLSFGLSRFSLFNMTQLLNGGILEGMAITFFLSFLYFLLKALTNSNYTNKQKQQRIFISMIFANLSLYTHERYIVLFLFIIPVILLFPTLKTLTRKAKIALILAAIASIFLNIVIKKYVFQLPFFVGTGGTNISFSFSTAISFIIEGVLSILQINSGPEYLAGIEFANLSSFGKLTAILSFGLIALVLTLYLVKIKRLHASKKLWANTDFMILLFLPVLLGFLLLPAVVTIRLEQRWLQGPFSIIVLMLTIALSNLEFKNYQYRKYLFYSFPILFICTEFNYLNQGVIHLSMYDSNRIASKVRDALNNNTIHAATEKIYFWEKEKNVNEENAIKWVLGNGSFFEFYGGKSKKIAFADSIFSKSYAFPFSSFPDFNKNTEQIIYDNPNIIDITDEYLEDSLKNFSTKIINQLQSPGYIHYNQEHLVINSDNFDQFSLNGFYDNENDLRWTNGDASIIFKGYFAIGDSASVLLDTYLPPVCEKVNPQIVLVDDSSKVHPAIFSKRDGEKFIYKISFNKLTDIQQINIVSDTIIHTGAETRKLSFPFKSLEIKNEH